MSIFYKAQIVWLSKEQGGRENTPLVDSKFGCIIVPKNEKLNLRAACWSLIIKIIEKKSEFETIAEVNYLSEEAPIKLYKNFEFDLYDGTKLVSQGTIL